MSSVAWLTCALFAVACARIYERCELARELYQLGIEKEHIPTWVCIAFHESRFDTGALNPGSGDHGLLQISELFWCGQGKACGVPCSAFRDEDISDDMECALKIYEEHTRLQGDGFMAWVVYPLHCKHTTKKHLADCDNVIKSADKPRARAYENSTHLQNQIIDDLKPSYLMINSLLREFSALTANSIPTKRNWINYKVDDIDELRLPIFNKKSTSAAALTTPAPRTKTTHFSYVTNIATQKSSNAIGNKVETITFDNKVTTLPPFSTMVTSKYKSSTFSLPTTNFRPQTTTFRPPTYQITTTTLHPLTTTIRLPAITYRPPTTCNRFSSTTYRPSTTTSRPPTYRPRTTTNYRLLTTTYRPVTTSKFVTRNGVITTRKPSNSIKSSPTALTMFRSTTTAVQPKTTTHSIFDLYLNPTRRPKLAEYNAPPRDSRYILKIFSDGTTAAPRTNTSQLKTSIITGGAARNQFRRETLSTYLPIPIKREGAVVLGSARGGQA